MIINTLLFLLVLIELTLWYFSFYCHYLLPQSPYMFILHCHRLLAILFPFVIWPQLVIAELFVLFELFHQFSSVFLELVYFKLKLKIYCLRYAKLLLQFQYSVQVLGYLRFVMLFELCNLS